jgi:hypothetical protein
MKRRVLITNLIGPQGFAIGMMTFPSFLERAASANELGHTFS